MRLVNTPEYLEFRDRAATWLNENVPRETRPDEAHAARDFDMEWQRRQYEGGWAGVSWPVEAGGLGLSPLEQLIWFEETVRAGAPGTGCFTVALGHAGPTVIESGTPEQRATFLPGILKGEQPWCQGFSEPDSGSDLASLRTSARIEGDELVINGQKIWTSYAQVAVYQELLVRTDPQAPKHKGISWLVVDMSTPGITARPIKTIDGHADFSECFYDDVRVPLANVVGGVNNGWKVAMGTLSWERGMGYLASRILLINEVDDLIALARRRGVTDGERIAYELARLRAEATSIYSLGCEGLARTGQPELSDGANQVFYGEVVKRMRVLAFELAADEALLRTRASTDYLSAFPLTIASGSKDIQKNIIGQRVLGLPR